MVTYCLCYHLYLVGDLNSGKLGPVLTTRYIGQPRAHENLPGMFGGYTIFVQIYIFSSPVGSLYHIPGIVRCMSYIECHQLCATKPSILCHHIWLVPNYISMSVSGSPSNLIGIISGLNQPPHAWRLMSTNEIVKKCQGDKCRGTIAGGPIVGYDLASKQRWLDYHNQHESAALIGQFHDAFSVLPPVESYRNYRKPTQRGVQGYLSSLQQRVSLGMCN